MTDKMSNFVSHLILHSDKNEVLNNIVLDKMIKDRIIEKHIYFKSGDKVETFLGANAALGVLIMKYESCEVMDEIVENFPNLYKVELQ